jgi:hypothetical protein
MPPAKRAQEVHLPRLRQEDHGTGDQEVNCPCGSGEPSWWEKDGQGIPLCRVCPKCKKEKLSKYRPEILSSYTQEDVDEPIEPDE